MSRHWLMSLVMSWRCRDIDLLNFNLGFFYLMSRHRSCDVTTLNVDVSCV